MNVQGWSLGRIMQLPDFVFGQRWLVGITVYAQGGAVYYRVSDLALPEVCVIWEVMIGMFGVAGDMMNCELKLGDQQPANAMEFAALDRLLPGIRMEAGAMSEFYLGVGDRVSLAKVRMPVRTAGRRLVVGINLAGAANVSGQVVVVVSALPVEVPDWLVSP